MSRRRAEAISRTGTEGMRQARENPASSYCNRLVTDPGNVRKILLECLDIGRHVHGRHCDSKVMSSQVIDGVIGQSLAETRRKLRVFFSGHSVRKFLRMYTTPAKVCSSTRRLYACIQIGRAYT